MTSLVLTDQGEVVVGTMSGIYTDKRAVIKVGDVIDGVTVDSIDINTVRVNSQGKIACRVFGTRQQNTPEAHPYAGIFVDDHGTHHWAYEHPGGMYDFVFGDTGSPYLVSFRSTYTVNGKDWSPDNAPLPPDIVRNLPYHFDLADRLHPKVLRAVGQSVFPVAPAWHPFEAPSRLPGQASQMPFGPIITSPNFIIETRYGFSDSPANPFGKLFFSTVGLPSDAYGGGYTVETYYNAEEEPVVIVAESKGKGDPRYSGSTGKVGSGVIWGPRGLVAGYLTSTGQITKGLKTKNGLYPFVPKDPFINRQGQLLFQSSGTGNTTVDNLFWFVLATPNSAPSTDPDRPRAGDAVLYEQDGKIVHAAIVWHVNDKGQIDVVRSKWGSGPVFDHDPDQTDYGTNWAVYRRINQKDNALPELVNSLQAVGNDSNGLLIFETDDRHETIHGGGTLIKQTLSDEEHVKLLHAKGFTSVQLVYPSSVDYDCRGFVWANSKEPISEFFPFKPFNQVRKIIEDGYRQIKALDTDGRAHTTDVTRGQN